MNAGDHLNFDAAANLELIAELTERRDKLIDVIKTCLPKDIAEGKWLLAVTENSLKEARAALELQRKNIH